MSAQCPAGADGVHDANPVLAVLVAIPQSLHAPAHSGLWRMGPLPPFPHTLTVSFSAFWLVIKLKATVQPIPTVMAAGSQGCTPTGAFPLRRGLALSPPSDGHPNPCPPSQLLKLRTGCIVLSVVNTCEGCAGKSSSRSPQRPLERSFCRKCVLKTRDDLLPSPNWCWNLTFP